MKFKKLAICLAAFISIFTMSSAVGCGSNLDISGGNTATGYATKNYVLASKHTDAYALQNYKYSYDIIGGTDVMPVGAFSGPTFTGGFGDKVSYNGQSIPDFLDDKYWQLMVDAGVNINFWTWDCYDKNPAEVMRALDQAEKFGVGYYVRNEALNIQCIEDDNGVVQMEQFPDLINDFINHPACIGVVGLDEPKAPFFPVLAEWQAYLDEHHDGKDLSVNLLPVYGGAVDGIGFSGDNSVPMEYSDYINQYMEIVKTPYLAYDYYPFTKHTHNLDNINLRQYFQNLYDITTCARTHGVPAWCYFQAGWHWDASKNPDSLFPSEAMTLWNINTLLAYGIKGLLIYNFLQSPFTTDGSYNVVMQESDGTMNYENFAMIGAMGNVNRFYYYIQKATKQLQAIDHILMNSECAGIIATGKRSEIVGTAEESATNPNGVIASGKFREFQGVKTVNGKKPGTIIGCFDNNGYTALYVVNNSIDEKQKVTLQFDNNYGYDVYQRGQRAGVAGREITLTVEAGEGVLVALRHQ